MARTKSDTAPPDDDKVQVATTLTSEQASAARIVAMVSGQNFSDWLRAMIVSAVDAADVKITVGGKSLSDVS